MKKTNFDLYLEEQLKDPVFAERFERAGEAWDVALQIAALREKAGLSQKDLARKLRTSQQNISRLESTAYEGHSLSMLRRVAEVLGASVHVTITPFGQAEPMILSDSPTPWRIRKIDQKGRAGAARGRRPAVSGRWSEFRLCGGLCRGWRIRIGSAGRFRPWGRW